MRPGVPNAGEAACRKRMNRFSGNGMTVPITDGVHLRQEVDTSLKHKAWHTIGNRLMAEKGKYVSGNCLRSAPARPPSNGWTTYSSVACACEGESLFQKYSRVCQQGCGHDPGD